MENKYLGAGQRYHSCMPYDDMTVPTSECYFAYWLQPVDQEGGRYSIVAMGGELISLARQPDLLEQGKSDEEDDDDNNNKALSNPRPL